jgi:hypothetical protein
MMALTVSACRKRPAPPTVAPVSAEAPPPVKAGVSTETGAAVGVADPVAGSASHASVEMLTFAVQQFEGTNKRPPANLQELVTAKLISAVPAAPAGMRYEIDAKNRQVRLVK